MKKLFVSTLVAATAMAVPAFADDLTWTGSSGSDWTGSNWDSGTWVDGSDAIFTTNGAGTVNVTDSVTANSVTIDSGASYTFNIDSSATLTTGGLTTNGSLAFSGSGTFKYQASAESSAFTITTTDDFAGDIQVATGRLQLSGSSIASSATVTLHAGGTEDSTGYSGSAVASIVYGGSGVSLASDISIDGTGGVLIRTGDKSNSGTLSGNITAEAEAYLQINGGGSVTLSGNVSLASGGYISYQGTTTFTGSVTLGSLEMFQEGENASKVIFSGSSAQATVGTLTVDTSGGKGTDDLQVVGGASLTVGNISLAHDINVTTDSSSTLTVTGDITSTAGSLVIGEGSTLTATGADTTSGDVTSIAGIAGAGTLSIEGDKENTVFTVTTDDGFTGTVDVQKGYLRANGSSIASGATLTLQASGEASGGYYNNADVSLQFSDDGTFASDITVGGESGGVIFRSGTFAGEIAGTVTSEAADIQKNGTGSLTYTGEVNIGGSYINYQGTSMFMNETTIGTLDIFQNGTNESNVVFSGDDAVALITTLVVEQSGGSGAASLEISAEAAVQVGDLVIDHNIDIAIDSGVLWVTDSVTQASGTSTTVTISGGGTLLLGDDVTLNAASISIVLGTDNMGDDYALVGGTITSTAAIAITVDSAVAGILAEEGEYTFNIYSEDLGFEESAFDLSALDPYGTVTWNGDGTITIAAGAIPEPSMFGLMFGLGAIGLVATRRRRRRAA